MKTILVVGESAKDIFVYCNADRLAPDLPIPVLSVVEQKESPGMAKNVERNIKNILKSCDLVTNTNWEKVTKTRFMHHSSNHAFLRVDADHRMPRVKVKDIPLKKYEIVAISDYNKGFFTDDDIRYICEHHNMVFIDTKRILGDFAAKAKYIKINEYEYDRSKKFISKNLENKIIVTRGDRGATFRGQVYPVERFEVKDTSGAGDSFFAAILVKYSKTKDIEESIRFANACASKTVQHRGVSVIEPIATN